jgi:hypothetical protein
MRYVGGGTFSFLSVLIGMPLADVRRTLFLNILEASLRRSCGPEKHAFSRLSFGPDIIVDSAKEFNRYEYGYWIGGDDKLCRVCGQGLGGFPLRCQDSSKFSLELHFHLCSSDLLYRDRQSAYVIAIARVLQPHLACIA